MLCAVGTCVGSMECLDQMHSAAVQDGGAPTIVAPGDPTGVVHVQVFESEVQDSQHRTSNVKFGLRRLVLFVSQARVAHLLPAPIPIVCHWNWK